MNRCQVGRAAFLLIVLLVAILPILWTALASVNIQPDMSQSPPLWNAPFSLESYAAVQAEQTYFWPQLATSIAVSALVTLLTVAVSLPAAFVLARSPFRGRNLLLHGLLVLASLPAISYAIPLGLALRAWHLFDTVAGITLAETAGLAPLAVFVLVGYVAQVPRELEAEAYLNGADRRDVLWYVIIPGVAPGLAALCALIFVLSWNQYIIPLVLSGTHIRVIPVMLRDFFVLEREFEWSKAAAVIMISLLPAAVFVGSVHRILEQFNLNFTAGSDY